MIKACGVEIFSDGKVNSSNNRCMGRSSVSKVNSLMKVARGIEIYNDIEVNNNSNTWSVGLAIVR